MHVGTSVAWQWHFQTTPIPRSSIVLLIWKLFSPMLSVHTLRDVEIVRFEAMITCLLRGWTVHWEGWDLQPFRSKAVHLSTESLYIHIVLAILSSQVFMACFQSKSTFTRDMQLINCQSPAGLEHDQESESWPRNAARNHQIPNEYSMETKDFTENSHKCMSSC